MDFLHFSTGRAFASVGGDVRLAISQGKEPSSKSEEMPFFGGDDAYPKAHACQR